MKKKFVLTGDFKQNVFNTPEGYFESLQDRIVERVVTGTTQKQTGWFQLLRPQLAFALCFVALVFTGYGGLYVFNLLKSTAQPFAATSWEEEFYNSALNMLHIDEQTVLHVMQEETVDPSVNTEEIINYLASANLSLTDIASLE
jgi:hypothetical protein